MVRTKNYETASIFVKVMEKSSGLFFSGHGVVSIKYYVDYTEMGVGSGEGLAPAQVN